MCFFFLFADEQEIHMVLQEGPVTYCLFSLFILCKQDPWTWKMSNEAEPFCWKKPWFLQQAVSCRTTYVNFGMIRKGEEVLGFSAAKFLQNTTAFFKSFLELSWEGASIFRGTCFFRATIGVLFFASYFNQYPKDLNWTLFQVYTSGLLCF